MASANKLEQLVAGGIGSKSDTGHYVRVHYGVNAFDFATRCPQSLLIIEADALGLCRTPPCRWVQNNAPEYDAEYKAKLKGLESKQRLALVGTLTTPTKFPYSPYVKMVYGVFSFSHGLLPKSSGKPKSFIPTHYRRTRFISILMHAIAMAEENGLGDIILTRIYGAVGGCLFSEIIDALNEAIDITIAADHKVPVFHLCVPKMPDEKLVLPS